MKTAIIQEVKKLHFCANLPILLVSYSIISFIAFTFIIKANITIANALQLLNITVMLMAYIQIFHIARTEIWQGKIEYALSYYNSHTICLSKFFAIILCLIPAFVVQNIASLLLSDSFSEIIFLIPSQIALIIQCAALCVMLIAIQAFFRCNTAIINVILTCFTFPNIIIFGLLTPENIYSITSILFGITITTTPMIYWASCYLMDNIYSTK